MSDVASAVLSRARTLAHCSIEVPPATKAARVVATCSGLSAPGHNALSKPQKLCYMRLTPEHLASFPGSSAVEQPAVNRLVAGSNPARGASKIKISRNNPQDARGRKAPMATLEFRTPTQL